MLWDSSLLFKRLIMLAILFINQFLQVEFHFRCAECVLGDRTLLRELPGNPFHKVKNGKKGDGCTLSLSLTDLLCKIGFYSKRGKPAHWAVASAHWLEA